MGRICPPGWNRVKVSENLGVTYDNEKFVDIIKEKK
jgi:hypothetical protein